MQAAVERTRPRRVEGRVEKLADDKVRVTVDVPAHEVHHAVEHAASDLAGSARIPGFRKGKVPMPILLQRVGKQRLYSEAVESHISGWFWAAVAHLRVNPIARPEFEYELPSSDGDDWTFSATVEVAPKPEPADWTTLEVPKPEPEVPQEAVQAELEALQTTVADLVPVDGRQAQSGDVAVIDIETAEGPAQRDVIVELGSGRLVEEIENAVAGLEIGGSREVAYELVDGTHRRVTVTLKALNETVLPPLDDDLARNASEFDTLADLRADVEGRLREQVSDELEARFRMAAVDELVKASKVDPSGALLELRTRELLTGLARSIESRGMDLATYLQLSGQTIEQVQERLQVEAALSVARELVLDAVADKLGIEVSEDEIREDLRANGESETVIEEFLGDVGVDRLRDDLRLQKAVDRVAAEVKPISPELHEARESIWTPEKEQPAAASQLWTPGSTK